MPVDDLEADLFDYHTGYDVDSELYLNSSPQGQWTSSLAPVVEAKFNKFDLSLLLLMWLLVFASSIRSFGRFPGALFLALNIFLAIKKPINGLLVLVLLLFVPGSSLLIPRIFVVSTIIMTFGCFVRGDILNLSFLNKMVFFAAVFVVFVGLTVFFARDVESTLRYLQDQAESVILIILTFTAITTSKDLGILLKWLSIAAALSLLIGATHHFLGPSTAQYEIARSIQTEEELRRAAAITLLGERVRLLWPGAEPNYFAAQLIFPLAVSLGLFSSRTVVLRKTFWILISIIIVFALLGTFSRSGYLAGFALLLMFLWRRNLRALVPTLAIVLVFFVLLSFVPVVGERIISIPVNIAIRGGTGRFYSFQKSFQLWLSSPVWGNGIGSVITSIGYVTHNTFLQILAELGVIGEILFVSVIVAAIKSIKDGRKLYFDKSNPDVILFGVILLGLIATCLHLNTITYQDPKVLWLLCGICGVFYTIRKQEVLGYS